MAATGSADYLEPGVYDYGQEKYSWVGVFKGRFTLCNNNNKMKEILPQTRHTIHLYGDKHDPAPPLFSFFLILLKYLFLNTMSALEINHVFLPMMLL